MSGEAGQGLAVAGSFYFYKGYLQAGKSAAGIPKIESAEELVRRSGRWGRSTSAMLATQCRPYGLWKDEDSFYPGSPLRYDPGLHS